MLLDASFSMKLGAEAHSCPLNQCHFPCSRCCRLPLSGSIPPPLTLIKLCVHKWQWWHLVHGRLLDFDIVFLYCQTSMPSYSSRQNQEDSIKTRSLDQSFHTRRHHKDIFNDYEYTRYVWSKGEKRCVKCRYYFGHVRIPTQYIPNKHSSS